MARKESFFDELARGLASGSITRGKALRLMGAAVVGGALASVGIGEAAAPGGCKRDGKKCKKDTQCCNGNCVNSTCAACPSGTTPCGTECCQTGAICVDGTCCPDAQVCATGTTLTCCTVGEQCVEGVCGPACVADGGTCTAGGTPCCSGNCSNGFCCATGRVGLSNGTCALPCSDTAPGCPDCGLGAGRYVAEAGTGTALCRGYLGGGCTTTNDCPTGQFCSPGGGCLVAC